MDSDQALIYYFADNTQSTTNAVSVLAVHWVGSKKTCCIAKATAALTVHTAIDNFGRSTVYTTAALTVHSPIDNFRKAL